MLIEDGLLRFLVVDKNADEVMCVCKVGGILKSNKGINLPGTPVNISAITERDWQCVEWAIENDLDYLALSFVRRANEVEQLKEHLSKKGKNIHVIAKIEKAEAIEEIDTIIEAADGLMIARGDLGVEMDVAQVPIIQKDLIRRCQAAGKPVIVATQMLQSMIENASPTRAEVSDVSNAIFDGTDAVMLSGETSVGKYPLAAVHTMAHVAGVTEEYLVRTGGFSEQRRPRSPTQNLATAMARGVWEIVREMDVKLVVVWSERGFTARVFSKQHLPVPVIALSSNHSVLRRMALQYGLMPREMLAPDDMASLIEAVDHMVLERRWAFLHDRIIIVAGWSPGTPNTMNGIVVHNIGDEWTPVSPQAQGSRHSPEWEKE